MVECGGDGDAHGSDVWGEAHERGDLGEESFAATQDGVAMQVEADAIFEVEDLVTQLGDELFGVHGASLCVACIDHAVAMACLDGALVDEVGDTVMVGITSDVLGVWDGLCADGELALVGVAIFCFGA